MTDLLGRVSVFGFSILRGSLREHPQDEAAFRNNLILRCRAKPGLEGCSRRDTVMPGLVPRIHVLAAGPTMDGRHKAGHDMA